MNPTENLWHKAVVHLIELIMWNTNDGLGQPPDIVLRLTEDQAGEIHKAGYEVLYKGGYLDGLPGDAWTVILDGDESE